MNCTKCMSNEFRYQSGDFFCRSCFEEFKFQDVTPSAGINKTIKDASIEDLKQNPHVQGLLETIGFYAEGTNWYTTASDDLCIRNCSISGDGESFGDLDEQGNNKALLLSGRRARARLNEWGYNER